MHQPRILVADDTPHKLKALADAARRIHGTATIDTASSVREALGLVHRSDGSYAHAIIDFDFPAENRNGGDIMRAMKKKSPRTQTICATARDNEDALAEAADVSEEAGARATLCFLREEFESELRTFIA